MWESRDIEDRVVPYFRVLLLGSEDDLLAGGASIPSPTAAVIAHRGAAAINIPCAGLNEVVDIDGGEVTTDGLLEEIALYLHGMSRGELFHQALWLRRSDKVGNFHLHPGNRYSPHHFLVVTGTNLVLDQEDGSVRKRVHLGERAQARPFPITTEALERARKEFAEWQQITD